MKISLLQINVLTGDIAGNMQKILRAAEKAAADGASLCITPELALCGVAPQDMLYSEGFIDSCHNALQQMAAKLKKGPAVLLGAPVAHAHQENKLYTNAAVLIQNGTFSVVSGKVYNPSSKGREQQYFERHISCGLITVAGWRLGIVLCDEDSFWQDKQNHGYSPLAELIGRGIDGIVHMTQHPYAMHRQALHERLLSHVAARNHIHLFSVNIVGGYDSTIYAGQSLVFSPTGNLLARALPFEEDLLTIDTAVGGETSAKLFSCVEEECWHALVLGTRDYVQKCGAKRVTIGLSGGLDSAMVAAIAVEALGKQHVQGVFMPSPHTSHESEVYAKNLAKSLQISLHVIPIAPLMQTFEQSLNPFFEQIPTPENDVTFDNIQARIRGTLLMSLANRTQSLVLGTGNKSEAAMGYSTMYGDAIGAINVIGDVPKTFLYTIATWYNKTHAKKAVPQEIINRPPTAELHPNQLDSDAMPPYAVLDPIIEDILGVSPIAQNVTGQEELSTTKQSERHEIFQRICKAEFKRKQAPMALRVTSSAFGRDWSIPIVSRYNLSAPQK